MKRINRVEEFNLKVACHIPEQNTFETENSSQLQLNFNIECLKISPNCRSRKFLLKILLEKFKAYIQHFKISRSIDWIVKTLSLFFQNFLIGLNITLSLERREGVKNVQLNDTIKFIEIVFKHKHQQYLSLQFSLVQKVNIKHHLEVHFRRESHKHI